MGIKSKITRNKIAKDLFTKNYKSPYAITDTFLNFINSNPKKKN